jgi:hypothetical protein
MTTTALPVAPIGLVLSYHSGGLMPVAEVAPLVTQAAEVAATAVARACVVGDTRRARAILAMLDALASGAPVMDWPAAD